MKDIFKNIGGRDKKVALLCINIAWVKHRVKGRSLLGDHSGTRETMSG